MGNIINLNIGDVLFYDKNTQTLIDENSIEEFSDNFYPVGIYLSDDGNKIKIITPFVYKDETFIKKHKDEKSLFSYFNKNIQNTCSLCKSYMKDDIQFYIPEKEDIDFIDRNIKYISNSLNNISSISGIDSNIYNSICSETIFYMNGKEPEFVIGGFFPDLYEDCDINYEDYKKDSYEIGYSASSGFSFSDYIKHKQEDMMNVIYADDKEQDNNKEFVSHILRWKYSYIRKELSQLDIIDITVFPFAFINIS